MCGAVETWKSAKYGCGREVDPQPMGIWRTGTAGAVEPEGRSAAPRMSKNGMIVAGVMSGTSADGIDVALVEIAERARGRSTGKAIRLLGHSTYPYSSKVRG